MSRTCGSTSRANRSVLWSVRSFGIEPIWSSTMRWPTRSERMHSVSCCRTVAGLQQLTECIRSLRDRKSTRPELQSLRHLVCRLLLEKKKKEHDNDTLRSQTYRTAT